MDKSPEKKRPKIQTSELKRPSESTNSPSKRGRYEDDPEKRIIAQRKANFVRACEAVSYAAYANMRTRFQLHYILSCLTSTCEHGDPRKKASPIPGCAEESFKIEVKSNMWYEALEVCQLCVTPAQYLTAGVLQDIVEIMLNANADTDASYTVKQLLDNCQMVLTQQFTMHPPCHSKTIRECYKKFLTSPMNLKENTFTNRTEFGCDKGIVKYCLNRLEHELSTGSVDGPLFDKHENVPKNMRQTLKGMHWQKEKFEIYEVLNRNERIERLNVVLESTIQLLQYDLAIWHSRHTSNQGRHIMRSQKPLMATLLWSEHILYTGSVTTTCRQILRIFVQVIHLGYPERVIEVMITWLNTMVQTFYVCETNSNCDYPNYGKYSMVFAREFHRTILEICPHDFIKIVGRIQPTYMQYLVAMAHLKLHLDTNEDDILKLLTQFLSEEMWNEFDDTNNVDDTVPVFKRKPQKIKHLVKYITRKCNESKAKFTPRTCSELYPKFDASSTNSCHQVDRNYIIRVLYVATQAFFFAHNFAEIQHYWDTLNALPDKANILDACNSSYSVSEHFIKKLRTIFQTIPDIIKLFHNLKTKNNYPYLIKIFSHVDILLLSVE